ncbi:tyrosine-type recombinase/integrase [Agathobacter rectalis]|uniref:tyrosine-type recombinase/integrase n=1 Tax=Agathobacter rectalis TaxID=39491 RepID=UPI0027D2157F|nr:tyrosine-type recombinase/integrase [Agathobacter rectalis]
MPLTDAACDAFRAIKLQNFQLGKICSVTIDGYTDFIFVTKHGRPMMPNGVNNALYNVVKYYNEYELKKASEEKREPVLIHQFSSHVMRHTGCTNMARSGVNIKAAQYIMGHAKSDVTLDVYNHLNNAFDAKLEIKKLEKNGTVMVQ